MRLNFNINADNIREKIGVKVNDARYRKKVELKVEKRTIKTESAT